MVKHSPRVNPFLAFLGMGFLPIFLFGVNPPVIAPLSPLIVEMGQAASITAVVTGDGPITYRWRLNNKVLAGETNSSFSLPSAAAKHAGTYELTAINASGSATATIPLTVFEELEKSISVTSGAPINLPSRFWGPGRVLWQADVGITTILHADINKPTLRVLAPAGAFLYYGFDRTSHHYDARLFSGNTSQEIARYELVNQLPLEITSVPEGTFNRTRQGDTVYVSGRLPEESLQYSARGLPAGCSFDETAGGFWVFEEASAGTYQVTWTVRNSQKAVSRTSTITIKDDDADYPKRGAYGGMFGWNDGVFEGAPRGVLQIEITSSGAVTGRLKALRSTGSFQTRFGNAETGDEATATLGAWFPNHPRTTVRIRRYQNGASTIPLSAEIECERSTGEISTFTVELYHELSGLSVAEKNLKTGQFAAHLLRGDPNPNYGHGFASMNIPPSGKTITCVGTLSDGKGFTAGGIAYDLGDKTPLLPFYFYDPANTTLLYGWLSSHQGGCGFMWEKRPQAAYLDSFNQQFLFTFARQRAPLPGELLLSPNTRAEALNARIQAQLHSNELLDSEFTLSTSHRAVFPQPNAQQVRIDFYAPTGFFTGSFMAADPFSASQSRKRVHFRGLMIHGSDQGLGFFVHPVPSTETGAPDPRPGLFVPGSGELSIYPSTLK